MKCVIRGVNIKIFAKAIHSLGKIGSELFIEPNENGLFLRSINYNKSAFASFLFNQSFFSEYCLKPRNSGGLSNNDDKFRISIKACLGIFKNMKDVEFCQILMDLEKLLVELHCQLDTKKNYVVSIVDVETLQATHNFCDNVSRVSGSHKIFGDISNNFQLGEEEITLEFDFDSLIVKNYVEGSPVDPKFMRSQLTLRPDEFTTYSVKEKVSITFCLREYRALLNFVENVNLEILLQFLTAGHPALFTSALLNTFEANLLLSTLPPNDLDFLNNTNQKDCIKSSNQLQQQHNEITEKETMNLTEQSELRSFGASVTFHDSQRNTGDISVLANENCKTKARTVFTRCFGASNDTTLSKVPHSTILAENSDTEQ